MKRMDRESDCHDNLVAIFEESARKHANNPMFGTKNRAGTGYDWLTYRQVAERIDNFRAGLASLGVGSGDGVAIISNNRVEWAVACYATYGLAGRFVAMYESELPRIWRFIVEDSGAKVLIVSKQEVLEMVRDFHREIDALEGIVLIDGDAGPDAVSMADLERIGSRSPVPSVYPRGSDIASLIYTSGTTGNPKGVQMTHGSLSSNASTLCQAVEHVLSPEDRSLSFLPYAHIFGQLVELHLLIQIGGSAGFAERKDTILSDLLLVRPSVLAAVPLVFNRVHDGIQKAMEEKGGLARRVFDMGRKAARSRRRGDGAGKWVDRWKLLLADRLVFRRVRNQFGGRLRVGVCSGAHLNPEVEHFFEDLGIRIYQAWGMTEISAHTLSRPEDKRPGSVGRPLPGCSVTIDRNHTGEHNKDGEIIAYGPNLMAGYQNLPEKTTEVLRPDGGLATGDRGRLDEDGYLYVTGRIKEQYKLDNGKYVFPSGIEEAIKLSPYVDNIMVEGANRPYNVAIVVPDFPALAPWAMTNGISSTDPDKLVEAREVKALFLSEIEKCCGQFASYEVPKKTLIIAEPFTPENGILTPTLKLKRREVSKRYGEEIERLFLVE